jgi:radical SAM superfamily enzyme YgiQ (UPF0313 family)
MFLFLLNSINKAHQLGSVVRMGGEGYKIVLTADRTLMSEYNGHAFLGFSACVPRGLIPDKIYFSVFCPSVKTDKKGCPAAAPCGLRRIEAALIGCGFPREDVAVAHPDHIDKFVGCSTKVVGITENDPLGVGPATSTFTQLFGGEAYMAIKFRELITSPSIRRYKPKIIVGGPGAWQLRGLQKKLGIDTVVLGEGEEVVCQLFKMALNGEQLPEVVNAPPVKEENIPTLLGPSVLGIVEVARGCGRGCAFCVPTMQRFRPFSLEHILEDVRVNLSGGRQPLLHAEDVLRYGARGLEINHEAVVELFRAVKNFPGVERVGISHFALSSVASAPRLVEEVSRILALGERGRWLGGQTGIETGSPKMIERHMSGKCRPFPPEAWPEVVIDAFQVLAENHWVPCATLIIGLPGEDEGDVVKTIELVEELSAFKSLLVPLFFVSMGSLREKAESFTLKDLNRRHGELIIKCWDHNLSWIPELIKEEENFRLRYLLRLVAIYGVKRARQLMRTCGEEYGYDLNAMIADLRPSQPDFEQIMPGLSSAK